MCDWVRAIVRRWWLKLEGEKEPAITEIDAEALWRWLDGCVEGEPLLVDVRPASEYEREHIRGSRLLPLSVLEERCEELPREQLVVLVCRGGTLSQAACELLARCGFAQVSNLRGGILSWKRAGLPYVTNCHSAGSGSATTGGAAPSVTAHSLRRATQ